MLSRSIFIASLIASAIPLSAQAAFWSPHVGVDYKYWDVTPRGEFYQEIFPRVKYGWNAYAGTRINGYFGFDVGYEESARRTQNHDFAGSEIYFINTENAGNQTSVNMRLRDTHLDLNFYWQVARRVEAIFMFGAAYMHIDSHIYHYDSSTNTLSEYRDESQAQWTGRIGLGVQYNPVPCIGFKAMLFGDNVRNINFVGYDQDNQLFDIHPYRHAVSFSLGVVYSFSDARRKVQLPPEEQPFF